MNLQSLVDAAAELNLPPSEYFALWDDFAKWQLETLRAVGLAPHHSLLDVGCGAMRLGLSAVEYLDDGKYFGVDAFPPYLDLARRLASQAGIRKKYSLLLSDDFNFRSFGESFEYANAQSVFTHLSAEQCEQCMAALRGVMKPGGVFLFTYLVGIPKTQGFLYGSQQPMQRLAVRSSEFFVTLGERFGARFEALGTPHPTGQLVGVYRYPA